MFNLNIFGSFVEFDLSSVPSEINRSGVLKSTYAKTRVNVALLKNNDGVRVSLLDINEHHIFSFGSVGTIGGQLVTSNEDLYEKIRGVLTT